MTSLLLSKREGAVLVLSHNNAASRNSLSFEFYEALTQALNAAANDDTIGSVVLTGEGGHFCSGGNMQQLMTRRDLSLEDRYAKVEALHDLIRLIRDFPKPVVAAVEGAAAGAGLSLALSCDMLVAARTSFFSLAYVKIGLTPDGGATAFLSELVSRQLLTELCLTGERIGGERMQQLGAVNCLTEAGGALAEAITLAQQVACGPQQSMASIKALCRQAPANSLDAQLDLEAQYMVQAYVSEESREGISAFLEKRTADFSKLRHTQS